MTDHSRALPSVDLRQAFGLPPGPVRLADHEPRATTGFPGDGKGDAPGVMAALGADLRYRQQQLFAQGRRGSNRRVLLVLQGMDTSGKGGVVRHAAGAIDPQGLSVATFGAPTPEELAHDFLWRVRRRVPAPGIVGVFDRSHYEDVLVARVHELVPAAEIERRYDAINDFEARLAGDGVTIVKVYLHIDRDVQRERLLARLDEPTKHWKYDPGDLEDRACWAEFRQAYEAALERCNTTAGPWFVVPAGRKWYRNWAVAALLLAHLQELDLSWPAGDFDVEEQRRLLLAEG